MKRFHCDNCGMLVFFQNNHCFKCGHMLGFLPDILDISTLEPVMENKCESSLSAANKKIYRNCANGKQHQMCNWMVPQNDSNPFCAACRLNEIVPDLTNAKNLKRWSDLELAKRRCIYSFLKLGLPVENGADNHQAPLRFRFLEDQQNAPVKTGHENGVITINIAEADGDEREHRRLTLQEPYRTLVGHLRHESGHYYWDRLVANSPNLPRFRELFGDETADYDAALKVYYQNPQTNWQERTVTAYASSHPWEDWAETWAHYLHIVDTLETAAGFGMSINLNNATDGSDRINSLMIFGRQADFDRLLAAWLPLTCAVNSINRGMGLSDLYPFVIPPAVVEKLRFIHQVINSASSN